MGVFFTLPQKEVIFSLACDGKILFFSMIRSDGGYLCQFLRKTHIVEAPTIGEQQGCGIVPAKNYGKMIFNLF